MLRPAVTDRASPGWPPTYQWQIEVASLAGWSGEYLLPSLNCSPPHYQSTTNFEIQDRQAVG